MGSWYSKEPSLMPVPGHGSHKPACADIMTHDHASTAYDGIFLRIFYPAMEQTDDHLEQHPLWIPRPEYLNGLAAYKRISPTKMRLVFDWFVGRQHRITAKWHSPLIPEDKQQSPGRLPVVIFSHGLSATRHFYSAYCSALASHGFVVVALEHRDQSACWTYRKVEKADGTIYEQPIEHRLLLEGEKEFPLRNKQVKDRVVECEKAFELVKAINAGIVDSAKLFVGADFDFAAFKGRLNTTNVAIAGHSFGGSTCISATGLSSHFCTAIALDGWMFPIDWDWYKKFQTPIAMFSAAKWQWKDNLRRMDMLTNKRVYTLHGAVHQSYTDFTHLLNGYLGRKMGLNGDVDPIQCSEAVVALSVQWLNEHMQLGAQLPDVPENLFTDFVQVETGKLEPEEPKFSSNL